MNLLPIRSDKHLRAGWLQPANSSYCSSDMVAPIVLEEIHEIAANFPIIFARVKDEQYRCFCLTGMSPGQNAFIHPTGKWLSMYVPSVYRAYPFALGRSATDKEQAILCIDTDSGLFVEDTALDSAAVSFFDEDGNPNERVIQTIEFLKARNLSLERISMVVAVIQKLGLLVPWGGVLDGTDETVSLKGIYRINEEAFGKLDGEALLELRKTGALALIYAHRFSMHRMKRLKEFADLRAQHTAPDPEVVSELFDEKDDTLKFNF